MRKDEQVRVHTRRQQGEDTIGDAAILQRTVGRLRGVGIVPRGLYRFTTHEEAQEWLIRQMAAIHARQRSKTSSISAAG
jgi:hypothetical protein